MHPSSIRSALARTFQIPLRPSLRSQFALSSRIITPTESSLLRSTKPITSPFSTSSNLQKKGSKGRKPEKRITLIRHFLHHPTTLTPRPLRFSRNRALRHWTIQRAYSLFNHKTRAARELEMHRMHKAMSEANEELRTGVGDGGRLFRRGMMKTGTWSIPERGGGVPIEYARGLTEWVGSTGGLGSGSKARVWDEGWRRWK